MPREQPVWSRHLAREGARVIASDISKDRLEELVTDFGALQILPVPGDIATEASIRELLSAAGERLDVLVNNVGIMDGFLPPAEIDDVTWERVLAVYLTATMRTTRATLPLMLAAGKGAVVNVSSEAGFRASASGVAYAASKAAVNSLTKSTALFYRDRGIRCNAVAPGPVATNIEAPWRSEMAGHVLARTRVRTGDVASRARRSGLLLRGGLQSLLELSHLGE